MDKLMQNLINAKKIMNKVEEGNFSTGNVDRSKLNENVDDYVAMPNMVEGNIPTTTTNPKKIPLGEYKSAVNNSKLPDAIKQAMLENPIPQPEISLTNSLSLEFTDKVAATMEKLNLKKPKQQQGQPRQQPKQAPKQKRIVEEYEEFDNGNYYDAHPQSFDSRMSLNEMIINEMKPLIKEIVQSTLENMIEKILVEKLNKVEKTQKMDENLQIKVGDSIFVGRIVGVKTKK